MVQRKSAADLFRAATRSSHHETNLLGPGRLCVGQRESVCHAGGARFGITGENCPPANADGLKVEPNSHYGGVSASQRAFKAVTLISEKQFPLFAAHPEFPEPIWCFVANRTDAAQINHAALQRRNVPIQAKLR